MGWTRGARCLPFLVWTLREVFAGVIQEFIARWAEPIKRMMKIAAIHLDHCSNSLVLSCYAMMPLRHC
jgi:hypothetical protein